MLPCRLFVLDVASRLSTELADCQHPGWAAQIADWSPDGRSIVYSGPGGIRVIGADGSGQTLLTLGGADPSWSPEGRIAYVTTDREQIVSMASDGSDPIVLSAAGSERYGIISPAWSPDGKRIAYLQGEDFPGYPAGVAGGTGLFPSGDHAGQMIPSTPLAFRLRSARSGPISAPRSHAHRNLPLAVGRHVGDPFLLQATTTGRRSHPSVSRV